MKMALKFYKKWTQFFEQSCSQTDIKQTKDEYITSLEEVTKQVMLCPGKKDKQYFIHK